MFIKKRVIFPAGSIGKFNYNVIVLIKTHFIFDRLNGENPRNAYVKISSDWDSVALLVLILTSATAEAGLFMNDNVYTPADRVCV